MFQGCDTSTGTANDPSDSGPPSTDNNTVHHPVRETSAPSEAKQPTEVVGGVEGSDRVDVEAST